MEEKTLIAYKEVDIHQEQHLVLEKVDFELRKGEFAYLIGKVGAGKSSFLKTLYADIKVSTGEARVLDFDMRKLKRKELPLLRRRLGIIFQDFQLLIDRSVDENLRFVLRSTGWDDKKAIDQRIQEVLEQVGMSGKGHHFPSELSGGEQQRIVIARAILNKPEIILADEPTGNLDIETGKSIVELLRAICAQGSAILMTTHNLSFLHDYPGKVYRCEEGKLSRTTEF